MTRCSSPSNSRFSTATRRASSEAATSVATIELGLEGAEHAISFHNFPLPNWPIAVVARPHRKAIAVVARPHRKAIAVAARPHGTVSMCFHDTYAIEAWSKGVRDGR